MYSLMNDLTDHLRVTHTVRFHQGLETLDSLVLSGEKDAHIHNDYIIID